MDRRRFFKLLTGAALTPVLAPLAKLVPACTRQVVISPVIGSYADYTSFSDLSLETSIDQEIVNAGTYYSQTLAWNLGANMNFGSSATFANVK